MGFFDKIKNALGIGGVKAKLEIPAEVAKDSGVINGKIIFTSKSDKMVKEVSPKYPKNKALSSKKNTLFGVVTKKLPNIMN